MRSQGLNLNQFPELHFKMSLSKISHDVLAPMNMWEHKSVRLELLIMLLYGNFMFYLCKIFFSIVHLISTLSGVQELCACVLLLFISQWICNKSHKNANFLLQQLVLCMFLPPSCSSTVWLINVNVFCWNLHTPANLSQNSSQKWNFNCYVKIN